MEKGKNINPVVSFDNIDYKYYHKKNCKNEERIEKKSTKDIRRILTRNYCSQNSMQIKSNIFNIDPNNKNSLQFNNFFEMPNNVY